MKCFKWLFVCSLIGLLSNPSYSYGNVVNDDKVLRVGEELFKEVLPLQNGARFYHLHGLKPQMWYEVKISYPSSIPASFSLQLKRGAPDLGLNQGRKLLNTEKIIFKTDGITSLIEQGEMSVLVNVEPEGVVAIPGKQETEYIIFNIACFDCLDRSPSLLQFVTNCLWAFPTRLGTL
ncbi:uncharacterized protein LOC125214681 isoform X2 [Salvia hispanica]|uniref:uncharacterized protein LOC125214681 isoform X2 n=1 Tax=Salvia hispanica TaxID=49212 RepID=UPI0020094B0B|nr:uncharacterized protein LOC125214681 isoform X2 [Salvia hispanica]